jgi:uncharacterized cupredoxin-like copper-binding protein
MKKVTNLLALSLTTGALLLTIGGDVAAHGETAHGSKANAANQHATATQTAWGIEGDPAKVARTVKVEMSDAMRFSPQAVTVKMGETVRFEVSNAGKVMHEMVIGTKEELDTHAEMMKKHPNMEHEEAYMAHVSPGKKNEIVWLFNKVGEFDFACLVAGHYEAGMRGKIRVTQ